ncbi:uncharacterized protein JCM6883_005858 [Sporobolomyces salmoneus]|uniref:uncharacterized protein n=1 Tax=Sporobolomyces salmoneus TaxID=183962 RepID=UPI00316B9D96
MEVPPEADDSEQKQLEGLPFERLMNFIKQSPPESDLQQIQLVLDGLDANGVAQLHLAIEHVFHRYPDLTESDLKILNALFDKGADIAKVDKEVLRKMMEVDEEKLEPNSFREQFEATVMEKFEELDRRRQVEDEDMREVETREKSPARPFRPSSSLTPTSNTAQSPLTVENERSDQPLPDASSSPVPQPQLDSTSKESPFKRSPSASPRPRSPSRHRSISFDDLPFSPPRLDSDPAPSPSKIQPQPESTPSLEFVRLYLPLPRLTSERTVESYFDDVLRIRPLIEIEHFYNDHNQSWAIIRIEKSLFISGELKKRIVENEMVDEERQSWKGQPFLNGYGAVWKLQPRLATGREVGYVDARLSTTTRYDSRNEVEVGSSTRPPLPVRGQSEGGGGFYPSIRSERQPRRDEEEEWYTLELRGFSIETTTYQIAQALSGTLKYWIDLTAFRSYDRGKDRNEPQVVAQLRVVGEKAAAFVKRDFNGRPFFGRRIEVVSLGSRRRSNVDARDMGSHREEKYRDEEPRKERRRRRSNMRGARIKTMRRAVIPEEVGGETKIDDVRVPLLVLATLAETGPVLPLATIMRNDTLSLLTHPTLIDDLLSPQRLVLPSLIDTQSTRMLPRTDIDAPLDQTPTLHPNNPEVVEEDQVHLENELNREIGINRSSRMVSLRAGGVVNPSIIQERRTTKEGTRIGGDEVR